MNCPRCTEPVGPDDVFCSACGAHLRRSAGGGVVGRGRGFGIVAIAVLNAGLLVASAFLVYSVLDRYRGTARAAVVRLGAPRQVLPPKAFVSGGTGVRGAVSSPSAAAATMEGRHRERKTPHRKTDGARPRGRGSSSSSQAASFKRKPSAKIDRGQDRRRTEASKVKPAPDSTISSAGSASGRPRSPSSEPKALSAAASASKPASGSGTGKTSPASGPGTSSSLGKKDAPAALSASDRRRAEFNAQTVRRVIRHYLPRLRSCYERATKRGQEIGGVIEIRFVIGQDGRVRRSDVHSNTTGATGLGRCIAATMARWKFPKPVGGEVDLIYPFVFSSGS